MITFIKGTLVSATPLHAVVEINGIGYSVNVPVTTAEKLPAPGAHVMLHTVAIYREDAQTLYGFATMADRDFFQLMIDNVSGIGPKSALTIMSKLSITSLESAIRTGDIATLSKCQGIGKKTAERLVVELRGKLGATGSLATLPGDTTPAGEGSAGESRLRDAMLALTSLGYKTATADEAVRRASLALGPTATTEQLIKKALS